MMNLINQGKNMGHKLKGNKGQTSSRSPIYKINKYMKIVTSFNYKYVMTDFYYKLKVFWK